MYLIVHLFRRLFCILKRLVANPEVSFVEPSSLRGETTWHRPVLLLKETLFLNDGWMEHTSSSRHVKHNCIKKEMQEHFCESIFFFGVDANCSWTKWRQKVYVTISRFARVQACSALLLYVRVPEMREALSTRIVKSDASAELACQYGNQYSFRKLNLQRVISTGNLTRDGFSSGRGWTSERLFMWQIYWCLSHRSLQKRSQVLWCSFASSPRIARWMAALVRGRAPSPAARASCRCSEWSWQAASASGSSFCLGVNLVNRTTWDPLRQERENVGKEIRWRPNTGGPIKQLCLYIVIPRQ